MAKNRTRVATAGITFVLVFIAAWLFVKHERAAHFQRLQGAWEGAMHFHWGRLMITQRIVLRISETNGLYRAAVDQVDLGVKNTPAAQFDFGSSLVNFKLTNGVSFHGALDIGTMEISGRWKWPGGNYSQPLALTCTNTPDEVQEPLAAADYAPRAGSDLQGAWTGTLPDKTPVRLQLKIAEAAGGRCRAELGNLDQPASAPRPVTSLSYQPPHVKIVLQGIAAMFEGELNDSHTQLAGTWTQGKSFPMIFKRDNPNEPAKAGSLALEGNKTN